MVVRHARAEPYAEDDAARRLTDRGRRDAVEAGRWLAAQGYLPTHAFVSSAVRARSTWECLAEGAGISVEPSVEGGLYSGGPLSVLESLRTVDPDASVVLYLGHNPTAASLAHLLDDGQPDPDAFRGVSEGFAPCSVAVLEVHTPWDELDAAGARLVDFHVGGQ